MMVAGSSKRSRAQAWIWVSALLVACAPQQPEERPLGEPSQAEPGSSQETPAGTPRTAVDEQIDVAMGQTIYVPVYSHIYYGSARRSFLLTATLAISNTDLDEPIRVTSAAYYDSAGKRVREFLPSPLQLAPLASADFVVHEEDNRGGLGAKFLVEWVAEHEVNEPIVEAVMIGARSGQGISWVSPGRVITQRPK